MTKRTKRRSIAAAIAVTALGCISIPLAAPGARLVPGSADGNPAWLAGLYGDGFALSPTTYLLLLYVAVALWIAVVPLARQLGRRVITAIGAALLVLFALAPPLLSLDVFSYISYARLGVEHGLNPYDYGPSAIPADAAASRVEDFRDAVSVYGPLFTLGSYPLGALGVPAALWSLKAIAALSIAGIAALSARLAVLRGVEPIGAAAFVALNPLVLVHLVGGAHNDSLMMLIAMLAITAALTRRPLAAGVGIAAAVAVKASGALYAPFLLVGSSERRRFLLGLVGSALLIGLAGLALFGDSFISAFTVAGDNQDTVSRWSVPGTLSRITGADVDALRLLFGIGYVALVVGLLVWVARGADWVRAAGWAALGLLVASAYMAPWYLIWLLPIAAVSRDRALVAASVAFTLFQVRNGVPV
ncbi:MAG: glycosyltransferase 87 family protein [Solirubrobacterales bacterium]